ncbi:MAG: tetratricopeptide repeat protein [Proteobacteria bacterium]|nr:tetratricopeptide repeat protein [Pseudomonadota bacterium]
MRLEVGKPLQAAQELLRANRYKDALAKVREADGVASKTAHETYLVERLRGSAAMGAGDNPTAIKSFEAVIASGKAPAGDQLKMVETLAGIHYRARDYAASVKWAARYFREGGNNPQMRMLLIQSYFQNGDVANAAKEASADIQADAQAGRAPSEDKLLLLANCYLKQNNSAAYLTTIEKLLNYYPKKTLWADVLSRLRTKPGFSDRLSLDVYRLQMATGNLQSTSDYMEMAQLALMDGLANEAKKVVDEGYANGALGKGAEAERQKRLKDLVEKQFAESQKALTSGKAEEAANAAPDGNALVNLGLNLGPAKGIATMEAGIKKGGLKRPEDAKLHLGILLIQAGQKAKAAQLLKTVQGTDGVRDMANLWALYAR